MNSPTKRLAPWLCLALLACGGDETSSETPPPKEVPTTFGGERPVDLFVPSGYDAASPTPLIMLLHGHGASGAVQELLFRLKPEAEARTVLYAHPNGTQSQEDQNFWNATEACCDFFGTGIDDAGYLRGLIDEISEHYNVDAKRIYFTGHSNGAYMSYRMACDYSDIIAGIAPLAGAMYADPSDCGATEPVHVLDIHGTDDTSVIYDGFAGDADREAYASAPDSVAAWAAIGGCDAMPSVASPVDVDEAIAGDETTVTRHDNCDPGGSAELWTIEGGTHVPSFGVDYPVLLMNWLLSHAKP
jgi:polyhydroxybutyrate depolymerase